MKRYYYKVYGIEIKSEIYIGEFIEVKNVEHTSDKVSFIYGTIPNNVMDKLKKGEYSSEKENEVYLFIRDVATYYISNGNKVMIDVCKGADKKMINIFLLGSVLGILMLQRKQVAIHGATITKNNKAFIITGDRGAGKSTLTTALRLRGYGFLSDDVASINYTDKPLINHGFPYQKLCEDAMNSLKYDKDKYKSFEADEKIKYLVPVKEEFVTDNIEVTKMFEIVIGDVKEAVIERITGHNKLSKILDNIYRKEYINACGTMDKNYFRQCVEIAKHIDIYRIIRPNGKFTVDDQIKLIENEIS
ncbi:hypothetical protein [Clostridium sp. D53t1_180928_C8]|uniref:hypothetical protein n=1 Tax=Clostridium sp. D53t1_180928_C8 TaxID=2787101 RepID=UPI0018ABAE44|nr:hypothetical protein [Clostridium sp. D53t1_180928_C8]